MTIDLTGGLDPRARVRLREPARRSGDARIGERVGVGPGHRVRPAALRRRGRRGPVGHPRHPGEHRVRRRARAEHVRAGPGARSDRDGRAPPRARRRPALVRARRAVPSIGARASTVTAVQTSTQAQIEGWQPGRSDGDRVPRTSSTSTSGPRCRRGRPAHCSKKPDTCSRPRRRARSWAAPASSSSSGPPARSLSATSSTTSTAAGSASVARAFAGSPPSGVTAGSPRSSPAAGRSDSTSTRPRTDGKPTFNEGYLFSGDGGLIPARVVDPPWLRTMEPKGEDVTVVLETLDGATATIRGETVASTFMVMGPEVGGGFQLQQAIAALHVGGRDRERHARALRDAAAGRLTRQLWRGVRGNEFGQVLQRVVEVVRPERREVQVLAHVGRDR